MVVTAANNGAKDGTEEGRCPKSTKGLKKGLILKKHCTWQIRYQELFIGPFTIWKSDQSHRNCSAYQIGLTAGIVESTIEATMTEKSSGLTGVMFSGER